VSGDDGETWNTRRLPGLITVGYTTATQGPNGVIHIVTSKSNPEVHIELNETWVMEGGPPAAFPADPHGVGEYREQYPGGTTKAAWSAGVASDGRRVLDGRQVFYYQNGQKEWEATFQSGRKTGVETWWNTVGAKQSERTYRADGTWTWRIYDSAGKVSAESRWQGKKMLDANPEGSLSR